MPKPKRSRPAKNASSEAAPPAEAAEAGPPSAEETTAKPAIPGLPRVISLIVLLAVVLLIGVLFFRVMATFLIPLFLAAVLAVVFKPVHAWMLGKLHGRNQLAALATTTLISLGVVVPTVLLGWMAFAESSRIVRVALATAEAQEEAEAEAPTASPIVLPSGVDLEEEEAAESPEEAAIEQSWSDAIMARLEPLTAWYHDNVNADFDPSKLAQTAARYAVKIGLVGVQALAGFLLGTAIMIFALYYFFADGPSIIETLMHLSPLDDDYERELLEQFSKVSRAVVLATLLAAFVQGVLAGVGYFFVLDDWSPPSVVAAAEASGVDIDPRDTIKPPLFLLTVLTMMLAIVPFVGATAVWLPVSLWVYFAQGDLWPAIGMAIYGFAVVSSIDNLIKPLVLHGQSNLHPLLALLSVLGGLQLVGPIGILVGPMLVAFMQTLLLMLRKELDVLAEEHSEPAAKPA